MTNMHCVQHGYYVQKAQELKDRITDEANIKWHFDRMVCLLDDTPDSLLSIDAHDARYSFKRAYRADGLDGGLVHINWLIKALKKLGKTTDNSELIGEAESTAIALGIEW